MPRNPFSVLRSLVALALVVAVMPLAPSSGAVTALASELSSLRLSPIAVSEGQTTTMRLFSSTSSSTPTELNIRRIDGAATPDVDFVDVDLTVTMPADSTQVTVGSLTAIQDALSEDWAESIVFGIFDPAAPDTPLATSTIDVIDDDPKFALARPADQVGSDRRRITVEEPLSGTIDVPIAIESRSGGFPYPGFLSASFFVEETGSHTATLGDDLTVLTGVWDGPDSFGGSQDPPDLVLRIAADDIDEGAEQIVLDLRHEVPWDGGQFYGVDDVLEVTITDPEVDPVDPVVLSTRAQDELVVEGEDTVVTVRLESPSDGSAEVRIVTVDGSASVNTDYTSIDTTVTLDAATRSIDVPIDTSADSVREDQFEDLAVHVFHLDSGEPDAATEPVLIERILIEDDEPQVRFERDVFEFTEPDVGPQLVEIPVTALFGEWPFANPLPSDDPEFDPDLGFAYDLRAEFVNPGAASLDVEWIRDRVRVLKGDDPPPFLLNVLSDSDTDVERLDVRLLREPRLGGSIPGPFVDDTATIVIGPPIDDVVDPADELRAALDKLEESFGSFSPPDLDLDIDGQPVPITGDITEIVDVAAEFADVVFAEFNVEADILEDALDDFEANGCVTDFVIGGVGGRKAATGDDVVQITCSTSVKQFVPRDVEIIDGAITDAFERLVESPSLIGDLDLAGDLSATVTVGIGAGGVYVGGNSAVSFDASVDGSLEATVGGDTVTTTVDSSLDIDLLLARSAVGESPERIPLDDVEARLAAGPDVVLNGESSVTFDVDVAGLGFGAELIIVVETPDRRPPQVTQRTFEISGSTTIEIPTGPGETGEITVAVTGVIDDDSIRFSGVTSSPDLELFGLGVGRIELEVVIPDGEDPQIGLDLELQVDASGFGASEPIDLTVEAQLIDGELRALTTIDGALLDFGDVQIENLVVIVELDTREPPGQELSIDLTASALTLFVLDDGVLGATGITGLIDGDGIRFTLESAFLGPENSPFLIDVSGVELGTPDADGIILRAAEATATVRGFGAEVSAIVEGLVVDQDARIGVSSITIDRGELEGETNLLGVIPVQLRSIEFELDTDVDGFITDLERFTITATAVIASDAFDDWPIEPVITIGANTIGPDTPIGEREFSLSARVVSVSPLRIEPIDIAPIGIGVVGLEVGSFTVDANVVADGFVGGELQPGLTGSITVDTGDSAITQLGGEVTGTFDLDPDTGTPTGLSLESRFVLDLEFAAIGDVVVDDLALDVTAQFGSATGDDDPFRLDLIGVEAAQVDFAVGSAFEATATDITLDPDAFGADDDPVLIAIGGDIAMPDSGATLRIGDAFDGFAGWGGVIGNVGITASGRLVTLDGFFIGLVAPDDETSSFGLPEWLPIEITELVVGFGDPDADPADGDVIDASGVVAGTEIDETLIERLKLRISANVGSDDFPIDARIDGLVIDVGRLLNYDFSAPFTFDALPFDNLQGVSVSVKPIDLGAVSVGGGLGFGSALIDTPDGEREALYLEVSGLLESEVVTGEGTMIISEQGPVLLRVTAPLGIPIGPTGFILADATGAATFGDVLVPRPDLGEPEQLLGILDGALPTDVSLGDESIADAVEAALAAGVPTWSQGGAIAVSGRLIHTAAPGIAEGDVTLAAAFGPDRDGGVIPGVQLVGTGDISLVGIDLFGLTVGGEVAQAGIMFDLSSPGDPRIDVAFESPTATSPLALLFPASLTAAGQLDLTGVADATQAGFAELIDATPAVVESIATVVDANPDSALGQALAAIPTGTLAEKIDQLLRTNPLLVVKTLLAAVQGDLAAVLAPIRDGARAAILAADSVFDPSFTFRGALQPTILSLPIGDPAAEVSVIINKDAIALQASGSLIESTKQASSLFVTSLPSLLFELATLDMTDRTDFTVQIPLPAMQEVLLNGGDLPVIDPSDPDTVGAETEEPGRFAVELTGNLSIAGSTMEFGGFYTAPNNQAVLDQLVERRFDLPADAPADPDRIPLVDRADYDRLLADGGFVLAGRALVPRVVTDPIGVIGDIGPFPSSPLEIATWFDQTGDAVTGIDDPISAVLVIPTPPSPIGAPADVAEAWGDWAPTVTFTGVFEGTAREVGGERTARLLSIPIGIGRVRATVQGIEVTADVPLAGAEATFVVAFVDRPTGQTLPSGQPGVEPRWGGSLEATVNSDTAIRNALTEIGLPGDWAPDRAAGRFELAAFTPGFDLSSGDAIERSGGVRATAGLNLGGIVDDAVGTIEIRPGSRPGIASYVDPDFSLSVTSDSIDLVAVELDDVDVTLTKNGSAYTGRVAADVELGLPGVASTSVSIDQSFTGTADLSFGIDRNITFLGQNLSVDLDVDIVDRNVSIDGSASGALTIGGVPLLAGGFDVSLSGGVLRLTIPDDDPISGRIYNLAGFDVTGFVTNTGSYRLEGSFATSGTAGIGSARISWNGDAEATVTRGFNGAPSVTGRFVGSVTAGGLQGDVNASIINLSDGRGRVIGSVNVDLDDDGDTNGVPLAFGGSIPERAGFSFVLGAPSPPDIQPPSFGPVDDITVQVTDGLASVPVTFEPPTATDSRDGSIVSTCDPASGSGFGAVDGPVTVTCTARDSAGNTAVTDFEVRFEIVDPPEIDVPDLDGQPIDVEVETEQGRYQGGSVVRAVTFSEPISLGEFPVAADGSVTMRVSIPLLDPGRHHLVIFGTGSDGLPLQTVIPLLVDADGRLSEIDGRPLAEFAAAPEPVRGLPATGGTVGVLLALALVFLVFGVGSRTAARRRLDVR